MQQEKSKENRHRNKLARFRRRRNLSLRQMAKVMGHESHSALCNYERGAVIPELETALRLEIVLRTPVAFLFPELYETLRNEIRAREERLADVGQQELFNHLPKRL